MILVCCVFMRIKQLMNEADAIIIGAGAGLSQAAGIAYGSVHFNEHFPELVERYGMTDMYTSSFYTFETEEERWSYWAKHIHYLYDVPATKVYQELFQLFQNKNYFVITTNVDGQFEKSGFVKEKIFEVQGNLSKMQCSVGCHAKTYDDLEIVRKMLKEDRDCKIPSNLIPYCPRCGEKMEVHLRKDAFFVEDESWHQQQKAYDSFVERYHNQKILLIELGVGFNTPGIIRFPFEKMTEQFSQTHLIRVNDHYVDTAFEIEDKTILIRENIESFITKLKEES